MFVYAMAMLYIVGGLYHFIKPGFYRPLIPPFFPFHDAIIYSSGVVEIVLGALLFWPATRSLAAWGVIVFLIAVLPVHIYMLQDRNGEFAYVYRWFIYSRPFIQFALIYWAYRYT